MQRVLTLLKQVSRSLFEHRWQERFVALSEQCGRAPIAPGSLTLANAAEHINWELKRCRAILPFVIACTKEGKAIAAAPTGEENSLKNRIAQGHELVENSAYDNMELLREGAENALSSWQKAKMGRAFLGGRVGWADIPLRQRREMNELLEEWEDARRSGAIESDEKLRELLSALSLARGWAPGSPVPADSEAEGQPRC